MINVRFSRKTPDMRSQILSGSDPDYSCGRIYTLSKISIDGYMSYFEAMECQRMVK